MPLLFTTTDRHLWMPSYKTYLQSQTQGSCLGTGVFIVCLFFLDQFCRSKGITVFIRGGEILVQQLTYCEICPHSLQRPTITVFPTLSLWKQMFINTLCQISKYVFLKTIMKFHHNLLNFIELWHQFQYTARHHKVFICTTKQHIHDLPTLAPIHSLPTHLSSDSLI